MSTDDASHSHVHVSAPVLPAGVMMDLTMDYDAIAKAGSFAAAARELGKVPSALTYSVRQLEDAGVVCSVERAGGHPFLIEELLRGSHGPGPLDDLPDTALAVVQSRLDRVTPGARAARVWHAAHRSRTADDARC